MSSTIKPLLCNIRVFFPFWLNFLKKKMLLTVFIYSAYTWYINFVCVIVERDQCLSTPCLHGGTCSDDIDDFVCACAKPYGGKTCNISNICLSVILRSTKNYYINIFVETVFFFRLWLYACWNRSEQQENSGRTDVLSLLLWWQCWNWRSASRPTRLGGPKYKLVATGSV